MRSVGTLFLCAAAAVVSAQAQSNELGLTIGGIYTGDRQTASGTKFSLDSGTNLQADYQHRVVNAGILQVYLGVLFLSNGSRSITSADATLTRDFATIYVTPHITAKLGTGPIQPWITAGGGAAIYEQSKLRIDQAVNPASRLVTHGAFMAGGGVDVPVFRFLAVRGEVRNFYTGSPSFNTRLNGGQNNTVVGGGFVIRWP